MAEIFLQFVPVDAAYQPTPEAAEEARVLLESICAHANEVTATNYPGIEFIDSRGEWDYPTCSACGASTEEWFQEAMESVRDESSGCYTTLQVTAGCCGKSVMLDQLHYPGGDRFASFMLETYCSAGSKDPSDAQQAQLERILGCKLIKKWQVG